MKPTIMKMNNVINARILTGWLLLLLFALPPAAKSVHLLRCVYVHSIDHGENGNHAHHDCNSCTICQFAVFPFTKTEPAGTVFAEVTIYLKPFTCSENIDSDITLGYMLRAPPY
jgi:hypothetical protein